MAPPEAIALPPRRSWRLHYPLAVLALGGLGTCFAGGVAGWVMLGLAPVLLVVWALRLRGDTDDRIVALCSAAARRGDWATPERGVRLLRHRRARGRRSLFLHHQLISTAFGAGNLPETLLQLERMPTTGAPARAAAIQGDRALTLALMGRNDEALVGVAATRAALATASVSRRMVSSGIRHVACAAALAEAIVAMRTEPGRDVIARAWAQVSRTECPHFRALWSATWSLVLSRETRSPYRGPAADEEGLVETSEDATAPLRSWLASSIPELAHMTTWRSPRKPPAGLSSRQARAPNRRPTGPFRSIIGALVVLYIGSLIAGACVSFTLMAALVVAVPIAVLGSFVGYYLLALRQDQMSLHPVLARFAIEPGDEARAALEAASPWTYRAQIERLVWLSRDAFGRGDFTTALELADRGVELARRGMVWEVGDAIVLRRAFALAAHGRMLEARGELQLLPCKLTPNFDAHLIGVELLGALATDDIEQARELARATDVMAADGMVAFTADLVLARGARAEEDMRARLEAPELRAFALAVAPSLTRALLAEEDASLAPSL